MGISNIFVIVYVIIFTLIIGLSQIIVVNVEEVLNFSITNYSFSIHNNFFECHIFLYNIGSKSFNSRILLESECCKIISENYSLNPSEETQLSLYYLAFKNESINISIIIENVSVQIKKYNISYSKSLKENNQTIFYIYENNRIKIIGNLDDYYFIIFNQTTYQKKLKGRYNEINIIDENIKNVKIIFFNKNNYFIKDFELKNPNIFSKILFEIRKTLILIFST